MDSKKPKKHHQSKKDRIKVQERFARKIPYRFTWLMEPKPKLQQPWEALTIHSSLREQLPLQKMLVPTRSIPVRGLGAPDFTALPSPFPPRPPNNLWEIKLLSCRFPGQGARVLSLQHPSTSHPTREKVAKPSRCCS
ncbi:uncharacterized protein C3orf22 homolog [Choloepus didactylus]|uniref:uncharacterized protein C3orf22 homolog n=1 Tax=Choloepus didactylus TaxID=27675 RepID=UPI00189D99FE|nr:uncharacterized protein C3orf22 homolog [Choloepus didactylus]